MKSFWDNLAQPFLALAPMEDVTNWAFRQVVARAARPDVFFTEFVNVSGLVHPTGRDNVSQRLKISPTDQPIVAQIWGNRVGDFSLAASEIAQSDNFCGIDINMGCPDKAVVKSGAGAGLIQNPDLAVEIIQVVKTATQQSSSRPAVSVKTRLGYNSLDQWHDWLKILLAQELDCLTVHLRTKREMSKVPAHHELIPGIIKLRDALSPPTKIIINGDIADRHQALDVYRRHLSDGVKIDGFMIGRGVFANPFCFEHTPTQHSRAELLELMKYHLSLIGKDQDFEPVKKFLKIYLNQFPGAKELRIRLMAAASPAEANELISRDI
jgi:tRNA-dihydrouridine synthase